MAVLSVSFWFLMIVILSVLGDGKGAEEPNTDGFFVSSFFEEMGFASSDNFRDETPACSREGVVFCGDGGRVTKLIAAGFGLSGEIPDTTIGKLGALEDLDLNNNSVTGFSSDFWGLGSTLRTLNLSRNAISGVLPNDIGNMGALRVLDLSHNNLSGEIPASFSSLLALRVLNLKGNAFEGTIPRGIVNFASLSSLDLSSNRLSGRMPDGLAASLTNLTDLNLAGNRIVGKGSDVFSGLKSVLYLNVSGNLFQGAVTGIFSLPSLQVVDVSRNRFQGHISPALSSSLVLLDVSENQLSGEISVVSRSLQHLNLARNRFSRQRFPSSLLELSSLQFLNLSGTGITGNLPSDWQLSNLIRLSVLDFSHNFLAGRIPNGLERLTGLNKLDFSWNNLSGEIPVALQQKLPKLSSFNFSFNPNLSICSSTFLPESFPLSFLGLLTRICPVAVNPDTPGTPRPTERTKHRWLKLAAAIALAGICFLAGFLCLVFGCRRRRRRTFAVKQVSYREETQNVSGPFSFRTDSTTWVADVRVATTVPVIMFEKPLLKFTFADLLTATSNFDRGTLLAEGKYGPVYSGVLPGGIHVAVKVLVNSDSSMGDEEAAAELESIGRIQHPNLVPLAGYCLAGEQSIAIYEFMDHGNLHRWLHDLPVGTQITEDWSNDTWEEEDGAQPGSIAMTWRFRHQVALGTARALAYLHHGCFPQIIHRDVKASSIYLDASLQPRLSDFGLAKIVKPEASSAASSGYLPPELTESESADAVTPKTDVYGFGVVLFELITGKKPVEDEYPDRKDTNLVNWVRELVRKNDGLRAVDLKIAESGSMAQMVEGLRIGYLCTADLPSKRPSMQQVVGLLKDIEPNADQ